MICSKTMKLKSTRWLCAQSTQSIFKIGPEKLSRKKQLSLNSNWRKSAKTSRKASLEACFPGLKRKLKNRRTSLWLSRVWSKSRKNWPRRQNSMLKWKLTRKEDSPYQTYHSISSSRKQAWLLLTTLKISMGFLWFQIFCKLKLWCMMRRTSTIPRRWSLTFRKTILGFGLFRKTRNVLIKASITAPFYSKYGRINPFKREI